MKVVFTAGTKSLEVTINYSIKPDLNAIFVKPLFSNTTWLEEGKKARVPFSRIELSFQLSSTHNKNLIINDIQVLQMLRVYKNGELFADDYETNRKIEMSGNDLATFSLAAYLGNEPA